MPIIDLGRIAYINKGEWNSFTTYEQKDVVSYNGGNIGIYSMSINGARISTVRWQG